MYRVVAHPVTALKDVEAEDTSIIGGIREGKGMPFIKGHLLYIEMEKGCIHRKTSIFIKGRQSHNANNTSRAIVHAFEIDSVVKAFTDPTNDARQN